jgi:hypothetical protein
MFHPSSEQAWLMIKPGSAHFSKRLGRLCAKGTFQARHPSRSSHSSLSLGGILLPA